MLYNYSAYLLNIPINTDKLTSTPVKRQEKILSEPIVFIAMNSFMFPKIFPQLPTECFVDKHCVFDARDYLKSHDYITLDTYMDLYQEWLDGLILYNPKPKFEFKKEKSIIPPTNPVISYEDKVKDLIKSLVCYRLDKNTPLAWGEFIEKMQHQAVEIMGNI